MTTPTDLRAALRDAADTCDMLANRSEASDYHPLVIPTKYHDAARHFRALADAPPTVAELLSAPEFLAGTHQIVDDVRRIQCIDGIATVVSAQGKSLLWWIPSASVLVRSARLVEVVP